MAESRLLDKWVVKTVEAPWGQNDDIGHLFGRETKHARLATTARTGRRILSALNTSTFVLRNGKPANPSSHADTVKRERPSERFARTFFHRFVCGKRVEVG